MFDYDKGIYDDWNREKQKLETGITKANLVHEGEIWWCSLGKNIGDEEDGKNVLFERPVLILKRFNKKVAWILPLSSKLRDGTYYHQVAHNNKKSIVLLSQLRLISLKRLRRIMSKLHPRELANIKEKIIKLI